MAAARYHHEPEAYEEQQGVIRSIVDVIHVANVLCLMLGIGVGADGLQYYLSENALERLDISDVEELMSEIVDLISQVDEEFQVGE